MSKILAVDSALNRLTLYGSDGKGKILTDKLLPGLLAMSGDRILLKLVGMNAQSFDAKTLEDFRPHAILKEIKTPLGPLVAVYQWLGVDHSLLATGLVVNDKLPKGFQAGLFRFSAVEENSKTAEPVKEIEAWDFLVLGYQYLTSTGGSTSYFLDMDGGSAHLFEIPLGGAARELTNALPPEAVKVPAVNATLNGPKDAPPLFEFLARQQMATGIYGGPDGNIYVLVRIPAAGGINDWWLFRVSVKGEGAVLGKAHLPSHAQHLSIVVSPDTFYLVERGAVNPYGGQDIERMIAVPASVLERAPLRGINVCSNIR